MTPQQVAQFFANFGYQEGKEAKPISLERYVLVVTTSARWFGPLFGQMVADCFMPTGKAVAPGYEDSLDSYLFEYPKSEELLGFLDFLRDASTHSRASRKQF
jgi:hypothetical protein